VVTGAFSYISNQKNNLQFKEGTTVEITITAIAGTTGDVLKS
jgi:hypothetical protein